MTRETFAWTFMALLLGITLSGCLDDPVAPVERFALDRPHAFSATVTASHTGTPGYANLSGPVTIADRSGALVNAYVYENTWLHRGEVQRLLYYLDGDFRLIVSVFACGYIMFECESHRLWDWEEEGRPAPDGLWYPNMIQHDDLKSREAGRESPIPWIASYNDGHLTLRIDPPWMHGEPESYHYTKGRLLPDSSRVTVDSYVEGGSLPPIASSALPRTALPPRPWEGIMFPGENDDPFGIGATHAEIARFAFPEAATDNQTCIDFYRLLPHWNVLRTSDGLAPIPNPGQDTTATALVRGIRGDETIEVKVTVTRDTLTGSNSMTKSPGKATAAPFLCAYLHESPWPSMDFGAARSISAELAGGGNVYSFAHDVGFMARYANQTPEHGLHSYRFDLLPEGAGNETGVRDPLYVRFESSGPPLTLKALVPRHATFER